MAGTCLDAASVARQCAATRNSQEYQMLSGKMCWDAVVHVALLAGVVGGEKAATIAGNSIVSPMDPQVGSAAAMANVPPGHMIGFFEERSGWVMIHAMISIGGGSAAGNKNDCIGAGSPVGWQVLNLARDLKWNGSGITSPKGTNPKTGALVTRSVRVCHRPVTSLA